MNPPPVRVVHLLFPNGLPDDEADEETPMPPKVRRFVDGPVYRSWPIDHGPYVAQDFVIQAAGELSWPSLAAELIWVRDVEEDEIFETDTSLLLLKPMLITELSGEYARKIFDGQHGQVYDDALAHLTDKAYERLLQNLGADYEQCFNCPWPEQLSGLIMDELERLDLTVIDCSDLARVEGAVISMLPGPPKTAC